MTSDTFPGYRRYCEIAFALVRNFRSDVIPLVLVPNDSMSRESLVDLLVRRHNEGQSSRQTQTNAEFLELRLEKNDLMPSMRELPSREPNEDPWTAWSGMHRGSWYDAEAVFADCALWHSSAVDQEDRGVEWWPRSNVTLQHVDFLQNDGSVTRTGWNRSHPDIPFLWGWDPKDMGDEDGLVGTHVGFAFRVKDADGILWLTAKEAFLELARTLPDGVRRRTVTGVSGFGQFVIE